MGDRKHVDPSPAKTFHLFISVSITIVHPIKIFWENHVKMLWPRPKMDHFPMWPDRLKKGQDRKYLYFCRLILAFYMFAFLQIKVVPKALFCPFRPPPAATFIPPTADWTTGMIDRVLFKFGSRQRLAPFNIHSFITHWGSIFHQRLNKPNLDARPLKNAKNGSFSGAHSELIS